LNSPISVQFTYRPPSGHTKTLLVAPRRDLPRLTRQCPSSSATATAAAPPLSSLLLRRTLPHTPPPSTLSSPQIIPPRTLDSITAPTPFSDSESNSHLHFPLYADVSNSTPRGRCFECPRGAKRGEGERLGVLDRINVEGVLSPRGMPSLKFFLPDGTSSPSIPVVEFDVSACVFCGLGHGCLLDVRIVVPVEVACSSSPLSAS
ncbi:hypothetical protein AKJ16_DCAP05319, partial [Drosera capensis]